MSSLHPLPSSSKLSETSTIDTAPSNAPLDASKDSRRIVRLAQCSQCSHILTEPVTLPCGNSCCKSCLPELHLRKNISYPATANRLQGFTCPFGECAKDHAIGDCSVDVVLNKILDVVRKEMDAYRSTSVATQVMVHVEEKDKWTLAGLSSLRDEEPRMQVLSGGRLAATYTMAEEGKLGYNSEVTYTEASPTVDGLEAIDMAVLEHLKKATRSELDCQICYGLFLDPLTASCGHTFCRKCIHRALDHSNLCPVCRGPMAIAPWSKVQQAPSNLFLQNLMIGLFPEDVAAREDSARLEDTIAMGDFDTALFICTLSFPTMPTFLHIFEPRYRLMVRRAIDSGNRKFGMVLHNPTQERQGELGAVPFYQYGTMLNIINVHLLSDGRSLIETTGVSRFRVLQHGTLDGYTVGKVERVDDISIAAEEALEASETSSTPCDFPRQDTFDAPAHHPPTEGGARHTADFNTMSTQDLMEVCTSFVKSMREQSAPWLHSRVFQAYGEPPDDPALFPWWLASVLPMAEAEKYKLLATLSVRKRLKLCAGWIATLEAQIRSQSPSCTVL